MMRRGFSGPALSSSRWWTDFMRGCNGNARSGAMYLAFVRVPLLESYLQSPRVFAGGSSCAGRASSMRFRPVLTYTFCGRCSTIGPTPRRQRSYAGARKPCRRSVRS
jgi:hypothetical protein